MSSAIHDLGYKRYAGTREATSRRWRVIMRHQVATAWRTWWRWKLALALAVITTIVGAVLIFVTTDKTVNMLSHGRAITLANLALPATFAYYGLAAFVASLVVGASIIAGDLQSGAFVFYFARSTRPVDYLLGKLAGYGIVIGSMTVIGPVLVALMRVGLSGAQDVSALAPQLLLVVKAIGLGLLSTLAYTAIPLGFSSLVSTRGYAIALWATFYLVVGSILSGIALGLHIPWLAALDFAAALKSLGYQTFDMALDFQIPVPIALISILGQSAIAIAIAYWKLSTAQTAGVGGAT